MARGFGKKNDPLTAGGEAVRPVVTFPDENAEDAVDEPSVDAPAGRDADATISSLRSRLDELTGTVTDLVRLAGGDVIDDPSHALSGASLPDADVAHASRSLVAAERAAQEVAEAAHAEADEVTAAARADVDRLMVAAEADAAGLIAAAHVNAEELTAAAGADAAQHLAAAKAEAQRVADAARNDAEGVIAAAGAEAERLTAAARVEAQDVVDLAARQGEEIRQAALAESERQRSERDIEREAWQQRRGAIEVLLRDLDQRVGDARSHIDSLGQIISISLEETQLAQDQPVVIDPPAEEREPIELGAGSPEPAVESDTDTVIVDLRDQPSPEPAEQPAEAAPPKGRRRPRRQLFGKVTPN